MPRVRASLSERFWAKTQQADGEDGCWIWTGAVGNSGYGRFKVGPDNRYAHRVALELSGINIPRGMHVDHLCEVPLCVNPTHLDVVTPSENLMRSRQTAA